MSAPPIKQSLRATGWSSRSTPRYLLSPTIHMAWKEFRQIVPLVIVFVALLVVALIFGNQDAISKLPRYNTPHPAIWFMVIMPFLSAFALTLGVFLFAPEKENKTVELLSRLPITSGFVIRSKIMVGLASILGFVAIGAFCQLIECYVFHGELFLDNKASLWAVVVGGLLMPLECFFWGVVCSIAIKRTVYAAIASMGCIIVLCWMVPGIGSQISSRIFSISDAPNVTIAIFVVIRVLLLLVGFVLLIRCGRQWLGNSPQLEPILPVDRSRLPSLSTAGFTPAMSAPVKVSERAGDTVSTGSFLSPSIPSWPIYRALIWQSFRQSQWTFLIAILAAVPFAFLGLLMMLDGPSRTATNGYILMLVSAVLMTGIGALFAFSRDHQDGSYRFFQQHVECGKKFWFARLLPAAMLAIVSLGMIFFVLLLGIGFFRESANFAGLASYVPLAFLGVLTALAIGQFNSLMFRSGVFAFAFTIVMWGVAVAWLYWLNMVNANAWWCFASVPLAILAISCWWTPRWLAGKNRISQLVVPHALVMVAALMTFGVFSYQRYSQHPPVTFSLESEQKQFAELDRNRDHAYEDSRRLMEAANGIEIDDGVGVNGYANVSQGLFSKNETPGWIPKDRQESSKPCFDEFLAKHKDVLDQISIAIKTETSSSRPILDPQSIQARKRQVSKVRYLLAVAAKHEEAKSELDTALDYWTLLLRFDESYPGYVADHESAIDCILRWSRLPNQTPKLLKKAIGELAFTEDRWERLADSSNYFGRLDLENWYAAFREGQTFSPRVGLRYGIVVNHMPSVLEPFEAERSRRMAHICINMDRRTYEANANLAINPSSGFKQQWGTTFPWSFWMSMGVPNQFITWEDIDQNDDELFFLRESADDISVREVLLEIQDRRYAQVRLALKGWKLEHGNYPESLSELAPAYFSTLPVDVFYGGGFVYSPTGLDASGKWAGNVTAIRARTPFVLPWSLRATNDPSQINRTYPLHRSTSQGKAYDLSDMTAYVCKYVEGQFELD